LCGLARVVSLVSHASENFYMLTVDCHSSTGCDVGLGASRTTKPR